MPARKYTHALPLKKWTVNKKRVPGSPEDKSAWYKAHGRRCPQGSHKAPAWDAIMPSKKYCVRNCDGWAPERHRVAGGACEGGAKPISPYAEMTRIVWDEIKKRNVQKPPVTAVARICGEVWRGTNPEMKGDLRSMAMQVLTALWP